MADPPAEEAGGVDMEVERKETQPLEANAVTASASQPSGDVGAGNAYQQVPSAYFGYDYDGAAAYYHAQYMAGAPTLDLCLCQPAHHSCNSPKAVIRRFILARFVDENHFSQGTSTPDEERVVTGCCADSDKYDRLPTVRHSLITSARLRPLFFRRCGGGGAIG